ncbi:hypothetical protein [Paenibacillus sinopodophylli]|uniref:hypothetical protein n=1 Tax=Paenibacillus sinopodophylli TaxID=1837342 RepID=UPI00110C9D06|nr:hypothetical protein [Paenibacillus sinopodophylli]
MSFSARQNEIVLNIAIAAQKLPLLESGLWFHHDIRDNFYYASYLFAAAADQTEPLPFDAEDAKEAAEAVLLAVLELQDQKPDSATFGHWPLNLGKQPREAAPNPLPVELMGSLMVYFADRYRSKLSTSLLQAFDTALTCAYQSGFYKQTNVFGHHDAKYTSAKLIFGQRFDDSALLEDGRQNLKLTLAHVRQQGMAEYNSLPWFWHWVQAFTCAWQLIKDVGVKKELADMLDFLWQERSTFYLKGAFVGAHCRAQRHDIPLDSNVLHDYVQFGDFELPKTMPRTEYAGFLLYEASLDTRNHARNRNEPTEVRKLITKQSDEAAAELHSYVYVTKDFAAGGMWERHAEFDNEQHRWDVSLPLDHQAGVNQAYFFHPSDTNAGEDPRHHTEHSEVLFHKNTIVALYAIPEGAKDSIIGILPANEWLQEPRLLLGKSKHVYFAVHLLQSFETEQLPDRLCAISRGVRNGVIMEVISTEDAQRYGLADFEAFAAAARSRKPEWATDEKLGVRYITSDEAELKLYVDHNGVIERKINDEEVDFSHYSR